MLLTGARWRWCEHPAEETMKAIPMTKPELWRWEKDEAARLLPQKNPCWWLYHWQVPL